MNAGELWQTIFQMLISQGNEALEKWTPEIDIILSQGTLASRILKATGGQAGPGKIITIYKQLASCLAQNKMFIH